MAVGDWMGDPDVTLGWGGGGVWDGEGGEVRVVIVWGGSQCRGGVDVVVACRGETYLQIRVGHPIKVLVPRSRNMLPFKSVP